MGAARLPLLTLPDNPAVLGYLAGLIDGEGCIRITSAREAIKRRMGSLNQRGPKQSIA